MSGEEDSVAKPTQSVTWRKLEASDFGILGVLTHLDAEISVYGGSATVRVNMISGSISNPLSVVGSLVELATNSGASELRIEGVLANLRLATAQRQKRKPGIRPGSQRSWKVSRCL